MNAASLYNDSWTQTLKRLGRELVTECPKNIGKDWLATEFTK